MYSCNLASDHLPSLENNIRYTTGSDACLCPLWDHTWRRDTGKVHAAPLWVCSPLETAQREGEPRGLFFLLQGFLFIK